MISLLLRILLGKTVGEAEDKLDARGLFRNTSGRDTRSDKFLVNAIRDNKK